MGSKPTSTGTDRSVFTLQVISAALASTLVVYAGIAYVLVEISGIGPLAPRAFADPLLLVVVVAAAVLLIPVGTLLGKAIRGRVERARGELSRTEMLQGYTQATVISFVLYESSAVLGLMLALLAGEWIWAVALSGTALVAMLVAWPRRTALEDWLRQHPGH